MSSRKRRSAVMEPPSPTSVTPSAASVGSTSRWLPTLIAVGLVCIVVAAFGTVSRNQFLANDDNVAVYENPHLTDIGYFWGHSYFRLYTPVTYSLYSMIGAVGRLPSPVKTPTGGTPSNLSPVAFHVANLVVHVANVLLVFCLLRLLIPSKDPRLRDVGAGLGALVFGLHPMQAEPVSWVNGANNIFSAFFALIALILYVKAPTAPSTTGRAGRSARPAAVDDRRYVLLGGATLCYILALLAKPTAVPLPLIAWIIDRWILDRGRRPSAIVLTWLGIAATFVVVSLAAQAGDSPVSQSPVWFRPFLAGDALTFYIGKIAVPVGLGFDYGRNPSFIRHSTAWYLTWLAPAAVGPVLWLVRRRLPILVTAALVSLVCLLPTVGLVSSYFNDISIVADRYVYLAMVGPAMIAAWAIATRPALAAPVLVLILAFYGFAAHRQAGYWRTTRAIMEHTVDVSPNGWFAQSCLGTELDREGDLIGAVTHLQVATRMNPRSPKNHLVYGFELAKVGRYAAAIPEFQAAAALDPPRPGNTTISKTYLYAMTDIGKADVMLGRRDEAIAAYSQILQYDPGYAPAQDSQGVRTAAIAPLGLD